MFATVLEDGRFVVFLHADPRSDGIIAAACCYWKTGRCFGMQDGVVVTQGAGEVQDSRLQNCFLSSRDSLYVQTGGVWRR